MKWTLGTALLGAALGVCACATPEELGGQPEVESVAQGLEGSVSPLDIWHRMNEASYHLAIASEALNQLGGGAYVTPGGIEVVLGAGGAYEAPPSAGGAYVHWPSFDEMVRSNTIDPTGRVYANDFDAIQGRRIDGQLAGGAYAVGIADERYVAGAYVDTLFEQISKVAQQARR
jgi:hypothetical protein